MHDEMNNNAALDYYFDGVYDEASFRCELKHPNVVRRTAALAAEHALRRLAQLRAANENASFDEMYADVFDQKLMERDLLSTDDLLRTAARAVLHQLVGLFDLRIDDWMERQPKPLPRISTAVEVERERLRSVIQDRADWARSHPPRRRTPLKLV
jgi:hypothetical protein